MDRYCVACHVSRADLKLEGLVLDDLVNRSPMAHLFFQKASRLAKESTDYEWPGSAMSMKMDFYKSDIVITFSERLEDYVYNLRQTALTLSEEQAQRLLHLADVIALSDESAAREMVCRFEENLRNLS
jgi:hypothetical protein